MKGQISLETIVIIGISTALLIPSGMIFYEFLMKSTSDIQDSNIDRIGKSFVDNAAKMYNYGDRARIRVDYSFPDNIVNMSIQNNNMLVFKVKTDVGENEYVYFFAHNATGTYTQDDWTGDKTYEFECRCDYVSIRRI